MNPLFFKKFLISNCNYINNSRYKINQEIDLNNCFFSVIQNEGNGGVILIENSALNMIIKDSFFYQCISSGSGGAIYFNNGYNSQLNRVCGLKCKSGFELSCQFSLLLTSNNLNYLNQLEFCSISKCFNNSLGSTTIFLSGGKQNVTNINISYNKNTHYSGIFYAHSIDMFSKFCTFSNNSVTQYRCFTFHYGTGNMTKSNIINNYIPIDSVVFINSGTYFLIECILTNNLITLLHAHCGSLTLIDCIINHEFSKIGNAILSPYNSNFSSTLKIIHFNTKYLLYEELIFCLGNKYIESFQKLNLISLKFLLINYLTQ